MPDNDFDQQLGALLHDTASDIEPQADIAPRVRQRLAANGGRLGSRQWLAVASMVAIVALLVGTFAWFKGRQLGSHPVDSGQIELHLDAAYADATMTTLRYHVTGPHSADKNILVEYSPFFPTLTSASGTFLPEVNNYNPASGTASATYAPLPADELGARQTLTLAVDRMEMRETPLQLGNPPTFPASTIIKGSWRASITVTPIAGTSVPLTNAAQTHGGISIQPLRLDTSPRGIRIVIHMGGLTPGSHESPIFSTSADRSGGSDSPGCSPTRPSGNPSFGSATLTTATGDSCLPDNTFNLDPTGKIVRGPRTITGLDSAGKPVREFYTIPASGTIDIELIYIQSPHGSVTLTFDTVSIDTGAASQHTVTGQWTFNLTIPG